MDMARFAIRFPYLITSMVILMVVGGFFALGRIPVEMFPKAEIPIVIITTTYPGAGPQEIESVITKPLEEELVSLEGLKKLSASSLDSTSQVQVEFKTGMPADSMEQKVRDRIATVRTRFPRAVKEPLVQKYDMSATPISSITVESARLSRLELSDYIEKQLKSQILQIPKVGKVEIVGGLRKEVHVRLRADKLSEYRLSLTQVADELGRSGDNVAAGQLKNQDREFSLRAVGEYSTLESIRDRPVSFAGGEVSVRVGDLGDVTQAEQKEQTRAYHNGKETIIIHVFRQSGANIVQVTDTLKQRITELNAALQEKDEKITLRLVGDGSKEIRDNVWDVQETILIGILLTVIVVYLFLGSARSTLITGLALPNSLLGAVVLMQLFGFSINILTLLALSLAVGLLVDDAIVVRENIFRKQEEGLSERASALEGTREVKLAVIATTLAILSVFAPVGFMTGTTGQFFREFGLTICFAMLISLFDALTIAPMLSAYWVAGHEKEKGRAGLAARLLTKIVSGFSAFQDWLEKIYAGLLKGAISRPRRTLLAGAAVSLSLFAIAGVLPGTFLPEADTPEFAVKLTLPPGTPLATTDSWARRALTEITQENGIRDSLLVVGTELSESHSALLSLYLVERSRRKDSSRAVKEKIRSRVAGLLKSFPPGSEAQVIALNSAAGTAKVFNLVILADTAEDAKLAGLQIADRLQSARTLSAVETNIKKGRKEVSVAIDAARAARYGVSDAMVGNELRARIEGQEAARFRRNGREYPIRVKLMNGDTDFTQNLSRVLVPNLNGTLVRLSDVAKLSEAEGAQERSRTNRFAAVKIFADLTAGNGLADAIRECDNIIKNELKLGNRIRYLYEGDAESLDELGDSGGKTMLFGLITLFLVLASLYESFFIPLLIFVALPLAIGGAFLALWVAQQGLDLYSGIGMLLLLGVAAKNSILLVDTVMDYLRNHAGSLDQKNYESAIREGSVRRLRPILMTSLALIAGTIPIAIGLNEASAQRTSMGFAIIGGVISSTLLTLVLLPALLALVRGRLTAVATSTAARKAADK